MQETFIKLDRSLLRHRYFDNVNVLKVWLWCLMKASHAEHTCLVGMQAVTLAPGQFVTGREAAARDLKMPGSTAWTILKLFEKDRKLDIKSNNKFSVISVVDYTTYQIVKYQSRQQNGQHLDNTLTANGQHLDTNNKGNKGKNGKKETLKTLPSCGHEEDTNQPEFFISRKKRKLEGKRLEAFKAFWEAFDYKSGRAEAIDAWIDIPQLTDRLVTTIVEAAKEEAAVRQNLVAQGRTPKMAQGWISGRRWEDECREMVDGPLGFLKGLDQEALSSPSSATNVAS